MAKKPKKKFSGLADFFDEDQPTQIEASFKIDPKKVEELKQRQATIDLPTEKQSEAKKEAALAADERPPAVPAPLLESAQAAEPTHQTTKLVGQSATKADSKNTPHDSARLRKDDSASLRMTPQETQNLTPQSSESKKMTPQESLRMTPQNWGPMDLELLAYYYERQKAGTSQFEKHELVARILNRGSWRSVESGLRRLKQEELVESESSKNKSIGGVKVTLTPKGLELLASEEVRNKLAERSLRMTPQDSARITPHDSAKSSSSLFNLKDIDKDWDGEWTRALERHGVTTTAIKSLRSKTRDLQFLKESVLNLAINCDNGFKADSGLFVLLRNAVLQTEYIAVNEELKKRKARAISLNSPSPTESPLAQPTEEDQPLYEELRASTDYRQRLERHGGNEAAALTAFLFEKNQKLFGPTK